MLPDLEYEPAIHIRQNCHRHVSHGEIVDSFHTTAQRVGRYFESQDLLVCAAGGSYLPTEALGADNQVLMNHLLGGYITYRITLGLHQGHKVIALKAPAPDAGKLRHPES